VISSKTFGVKADHRIPIATANAIEVGHKNTHKYSGTQGPPIFCRRNRILIHNPLLSKKPTPSRVALSRTNVAGPPNKH